MKQSQFLAIAIKNVFSLFTCSITFLAIALPSLSQNISSNCYMLNQSGEVVDLSEICGNNSKNDNNSSLPPSPPQETSKNTDIPQPSPDKTQNPETNKQPDSNNDQENANPSQPNRKKTIPVIQN